ncbi:DNA repair protein XRCC2 [Lepisosteus oculatus]|uniref:DNA repair protein XRCC2 n=1 Tax=Lepisosteus oculatus TaxID=7918 RepID=UPI0037223D57
MTHDVSSAESGAQLFARLEGRSSLKNIEPRIFPEEGAPVPGDVVEFYGTEGTGKTETIYHLVARCILPAENGGLEVEVMFVDTDYHFDMLRLVSILEHRLPQSPEETIRMCLRRLFVVHCTSTVHLLLTLHYVENMFCSRPALCLLVIDSISAFYWIDRSNGGESVTQQESNLGKCSAFLEKLLRDYRIVLFASTQAIMRSYSGEPSRAAGASSSWRRCPAAEGDYSKPYLCKAWQRLVTHQLAFSKTDARRDSRAVFSIASSSAGTKSTSRCFFCVTEGGVQFF